MIHKCILVHLFHITTVYIYRYTDICIIEGYFSFCESLSFRFAKTVTCMIKVPKDHIYKEKFLSLPYRCGKEEIELEILWIFKYYDGHPKNLVVF